MRTTAETEKQFLHNVAKAFHQEKIPKYLQSKIFWRPITSQQTRLGTLLLSCLEGRNLFPSKARSFLKILSQTKKKSQNFGKQQNRSDLLARVHTDIHCKLATTSATHSQVLSQLGDAKYMQTVRFCSFAHMTCDTRDADSGLRAESSQHHRTIDGNADRESVKSPTRPTKTLWDASEAEVLAELGVGLSCERLIT